MTATLITRHPNGVDAWVQWTAPLTIIAASHAAQLPGLLSTLTRFAQEDKYALGFISYEAGPGFDPAFSVKNESADLPLAWFAVYDRFEVLVPSAMAKVPRMRWRPAVTKNIYRQKIREIKKHIAAGDTYQVNYTFPLQSGSPVDMRSLFFQLYASQPSPFAMLIEAEDFEIASASPELFFRQEGEVVRTQPMKGTCPRGPHPLLDAAAGESLQRSEKNRAENLMIVDMVRNDLGRVARPGSIEVEALFEVTPWPTLWQMTSTIRAETQAGWPEVMAALFPCASITGAPKIKTSEIIAGLEVHPRGLYTGAIGWCGPGRRSQWAVAIRTATRPRQHTATYGVGSGIVWDSEPGQEFQECLLKSRVLYQTGMPSYRLMETFRWEPAIGYLFLDGHLDRLCSSGRFLGFTADRENILARLERAQQEFGGTARRVRLVMDHRGRIQITHTPAMEPGHFNEPHHAPVMTAALDSRRLTSDTPFFFHKTTRRKAYQQARNRFPEVDDVLLVNAQDQLTEFTLGNLVIFRDGNGLTPSLACGLLPGVFRQQLITTGFVQEAVLSLADRLPGDEYYFINSLRGWRRVNVLPDKQN